MLLGSCHRVSESGQDVAGLHLWAERRAQGTEKDWGLGWWWWTQAWGCDQDVWVLPLSFASGHTDFVCHMAKEEEHITNTWLYCSSPEITHRFFRFQ